MPFIDDIINEIHQLHDAELENLEKSYERYKKNMSKKDFDNLIK